MPLWGFVPRFLASFIQKYDNFGLNNAYEVFSFFFFYSSFVSTLLPHCFGLYILRSSSGVNLQMRITVFVDDVFYSYLEVATLADALSEHSDVRGPFQFSLSPSTFLCR